MSRENLKKGRINQKQRTRNALLEAANRLVDKGKNPTIDEIAEEAMVSRATAYRYFPKVERLLIEAPLHRRTASPEEILAGAEKKSSSERAVVVHDYLYDVIDKNEMSFRMYLRACMDEWVSSKGKLDENLRGRRRLPMIDEALKELTPNLTKTKYRKLRYSIAAMVSLESFIALRDVCGLESSEAKKIMRWAVQTLVDSVNS